MIFFEKIIKAQFHTLKAKKAMLDALLITVVHKSVPLNKDHFFVLGANIF